MRKTRHTFMTLCLALMMLWTCPAMASQREAAQTETKDAILLVAFGTSVQEAQTSYAHVEQQVRAAFPGKEIRWAWTAKSLLNSDPKSPRLSVQEALAKLAAEGVKKVSILSLHIIPGSEYSDLARTAHALEGLPKGIREIRLSQPLLHDADSLADIANMLIQNAPKERQPGDALVFVGHGSRHAADVYYPALQYYLHRLDKNAFVGTVEGSPKRDDVLAALQGNSIRKVWLVPLMTVAGDHASNDLFGPEKDSWKQVFQAHGMQVEAVRKGLGDYPALVEQWVRNLKDAAN